MTRSQMKYPLSLHINKAVIVIMLLTWLVFSVQTWLQPMVSDDFLYGLVYSNGAADLEHPIHSFSDVIDSQLDHFIHVNGRAPIHVLLQAIDGLCGKWLFNIINPVVFCLFIVVLNRYSLQTINAKGVILSLTLLYGVFPLFGHVFMWMSGAMNYLWSSVLILFLLVILPSHEQTTLTCKSVGILVLAFFAGWSHEGISIPFAMGLMAEVVFKKRVNWRSEGWWMNVVFLMGAILCMVPSLYRAAPDKDFGTTDIQYKLDIGIGILGLMGLLFIFLITLTAALVFRKVRAKQFLVENIVPLIALFVGIAIVFYAAQWNNLRVAYTVELTALIMTLRLGRKFSFSLKTQWLVIFASLVLLLFAASQTLYYSYLNDKEYETIENQLNDGSQMVYLNSAKFPELADKNIYRTYNYYSYDFSIFDPDQTLCTVMASLYHLDYMLFMPDVVMDKMSNHPEELVEFNDCGGMPFYVRRLPDDREVTDVRFVLRAARESEIPWYHRPFSASMERYGEALSIANFAWVCIDGNYYLFCKKDADFDDRVTEIEIIYSDSDGTRP